jgi:hypothetical protein
MSESEEKKDALGNRYQQHDDGSRSYERTDAFGNKYWEHPDSKWSQQRTGAWGNRYEQHSDGKWSVERTDAWGSKYKEHSNGTRSYQKTDIWGNTYWEHSGSNPYNAPVNKDTASRSTGGDAVGGLLGGLIVVLFIGWFALFANRKAIAILLPMMLILSFISPFRLLLYSPFAVMIYAAAVVAFMPLFLIASNIDLGKLAAFALSAAIGMILGTRSMRGLPVYYLPSLLHTLLLTCMFFALYLLLRRWLVSKITVPKWRVALQFAGGVIVARLIVDAVYVPTTYHNAKHMLDAGFPVSEYLIGYGVLGTVAFVVYFLTHRTKQLLVR